MADRALVCAVRSSAAREDKPKRVKKSAPVRDETLPIRLRPGACAGRNRIRFKNPEHAARE